MKFAITTPNGKVGSKLVDELLDRGGHELALLCRDRDTVRRAAERGATVFEGPLEDFAFFTRATRGIDALFLVLPMDSRSQRMNEECGKILDSACNAIQENRISRVVFVSSMGAHRESGTGPILHHREAERRLRQVAPNVTVLRPAFYMDQFLGWMHDVAERQALYTTLPTNTELPLVAARDVAGYGADVLTDLHWSGWRIVPLHGPRRYTYEQIAGILGQVMKMPVRPVRVAPQELSAMLSRRGWANPAVERYLELQQATEAGLLEEEVPRSEWVTRNTTFEEFARAEFKPSFERFAATAMAAP